MARDSVALAHRFAATMSRRHLILVTSVRVVAAGVLLFAGFGKLYAGLPSDESVYAGVIRGWLAGHYLVCAAEIGLAAWLLLERREVMALRIALAGASAMVGIVGFELTRENPRVCGCFGAVSHSLRPWFSFVLNLCLLTMIAIAVLFASARTRPRQHAVVPLSPCAPSRAGFTLVEVLVSLGIVAILLALAVGMITSTRARAGGHL